jgi:hypothetical protein
MSLVCLCLSVLTSTYESYRWTDVVFQWNCIILRSTAKIYVCFSSVITFIECCMVVWVVCRYQFQRLCNRTRNERVIIHGVTGGMWDSGNVSLKNCLLDVWRVWTKLLHTSWIGFQSGYWIQSQSHIYAYIKGSRNVVARSPQASYEYQQLV